MAYHRMGEAVAEFFVQHPELLTLSVILSETVTELRQLLVVLRANIDVQANTLKGNTATKNSLRQLINKQMEIQGNFLSSYFWLKRMTNERTEVESALKNFRDAKDGTVRMLVDKLTNLGLKEDVTELAKANFERDQLVTLQNHGHTYDALVTGRVISHDERVEATAHIATTLARIKEIVSQGISGLMTTFSDTHPELVTLFNKVKAVEYPTSRHRKPDEDESGNLVIATFRFTNSMTGEPIEGVAVALDGMVQNDLSDDNGELYFDNLTPGDLLVAASAPGYHSREWTTPVLEGGEEYDFEEQLTPEA